MMNPLFYYIPGSEPFKDGQESHVPAPVRAAAKGCAVSTVRVLAGPDGGAGVLAWFAPRAGESSRKIGYYPDEQTWQPGADSAYWVGAYTDAMPGPDDLQRSECIAGYNVELGDGNRWTLPVARYADGGTQFPKSVNWGPDGAPVEKVLPQYRAMCDSAWELHSHFVDSGNLGEVDNNPALYGLAADALIINYAVCKWALGLLGIITSDTVGVAIGCLFDLPQVLLWEKKKTLNGCDTDDGEKDTNQS